MLLRQSYTSCVLHLTQRATSYPGKQGAAFWPVGSNFGTPEVESGQQRRARTLGGPYFHLRFSSGFLYPSAAFGNRGVGCAEEGVRRRLDKKRGCVMGRQAVTGRDDTSPNRHP